MEFTATDFWILLPTLVLAVGACLVIVADLLAANKAIRQALVHSLSLTFLGIAIVLSWYQYSPANFEKDNLDLIVMGPSIQTAWHYGMYTILGALILELLTFMAVLLSGSWLSSEDDQHHGEYHALMLLFCVGANIFISAKNLMLAFIGLEIFSVALYVLVAIRRKRKLGVEAGLKYFLLGAFAAATFLYATSLIYAGNGNLDIPKIGPIGGEGIPGPEGLAAIGGALLFVALFFKASVVPFHMWTPDVYQGAPTPVTALMATGTKAAAFIMLFWSAKFIPHELLPLLPGLAILTMAVGNLGALVQSNVKRLLAYSGIAHAGVIMIAFNVLTRGQQGGDTATALRAMLFYVVTYGITSIAAFSVIAYLEKNDERVLTLSGLRGLSRRNPLSAIVLALSALSLAGVPPTAGFWGKYQIFAAAIRSNMTPLAVIAILVTVIGLYYYLKIIVYSFLLPTDEDEPIPATGWGARIAMTTTAVLIIVIGFMPQLLIDRLSHIRL